jgi:hypothetical protein
VYHAAEALLNTVIVMDPGYPKPIAGNWQGLPSLFTSGIDAALMRRDNHKIYFFKDSQYVRIDGATSVMDPGYPNWIDKNWMPFPPGDPVLRAADLSESQRATAR